MKKKVAQKFVSKISIEFLMYYSRVRFGKQLLLDESPEIKIKIFYTLLNTKIVI